MIEWVLICSFITICLFVYNEFCAYYFMKKPKIHAKFQSSFYEEMVQHCQTLTQPYIPTFWASNRHLQTWLKTLMSFQEVPQISIMREYLQMEDNGIVSIDWVSKADVETIDKRPITPSKRRLKKKSVNTKSERPILLIIPNTLNTRVKDYSHLCTSAFNKGFKPIFFNRRGYSGTTLNTPKITTYCDRFDLQEVLCYIKNQFPFSDIYAIAFSMESGNLISYLGHEKETSEIAGAVCVSSTFGCENHLDNYALKQPYNYIITEKIKTILQNDAVFGETFGNINVNDCHTMVQLQNEIHARSNHYETLNEYLNYNSPLTHLNRIKVPVLFIQSKDDPVISQYSIPYEFFAISDSCVLVETEYGGHCGFFQDFFPSSWADETALDFLKFISKRNKLPMIKSARSRAMTIL